MQRSKSTTKRPRKFIRKDSAREYASRNGLLPVASTDGTSTYFKPTDILPPEPKPISAPCSYCGKPTIRTKPDANGDLIPTCVMCGIAHV